MEQTVIGSALQYLKYEVGVPIPRMVWYPLSAIYAATVEGPTVVAVIRAAGFTWMWIERPILWLRGIQVIPLP